MRKILMALCGMCIAHAGLGQQAEALTDSSGTQSNVVVFLVDDMGWKDLGCYGAKLYETPNVDRLCTEGMRYTQMYTSAPICSPARATLMTGRNPLELGMWTFTHILPPDTKTILPGYLKQRGYQTWHIGKWHLGKNSDGTLPHQLGFDCNIAGSMAHEPKTFFWPYKFTQVGTDPVPPDSAKFNSLMSSGQEGEYLTDRLTQEALQLIDQRDPEKPFFLNFSFYQVHNTNRGRKEGKPELVKKYEQKINRLGLKPTHRKDPKTGRKLLTSETNPKYAAMIESMDTAVGQVVDKLKEIGEFDNTLFLFLSDNGPTTNDVPCTPLNGGKNSTYEAGLRVPAIAVWAGRIQPGSEYKGPVYLADIFNTIVEVADAELPPDYPSDGTSLLPTFKGQSLDVERQLVWYFPESRMHWGQRANAALFDAASQMKYILFFTGDEDEMYHISSDLGERKNVIAEWPEVASRLETSLRKKLNGYYPHLPEPPKKYKAGVEARLKE
jgi:arylsulfatase A-like enzyme